MADKSSFTTEEWGKVMGAALLAGMAVSAAAPSGLWGLLKEGIASSKAVVIAKEDVAVGGLIKAVATDVATSEGRAAARAAIKAALGDAKTAPEMEANILATLTEVGAILDTKAPEDAAAFKAWLHAIGEKTAEASGEGGFLGFGSVQVSDAEKAALDQIARALHVKTA